LWDSCTDPFTDEANYSVLKQTQGIHLRVKIRLNRFILSSSGGEKPQFLPFFWTLAFSDVDSWRQSEKVELNMDTQLQTFPYPTASKSFLYSNAFMAKSGAQSLTFKSVTDRQTNGQKLNVFGRSGGG